jgi:hypothetical protein
MPAIQAVMVMVESLNQFQRVPSSSVYSSVPRPTDMRTMPR